MIWYQTALCKVVSQAMRGNAFVQADATKIILEIGLEVADLNMIACVAASREEVIGL